MQIATFDFGTTAIKFVVLDDKTNILYTNKKDIDTIIDKENNHIEQDPIQWLDTFIELINSYPQKQEITALICSGQMQDLILIDKYNKPIRNAILYNDQRGDKYLNKITNIKEIEAKTTIHLNGSIPLVKMKYLEYKEKEALNQTKTLLFSPKDYITLYLTGKAVADTTTLSTTGMMDIRKREYIKEVEDYQDILPTINTPGEPIATINKDIAEQLNLNKELKVYTGSGDAGATTLASGISEPNELNINLGTSGWIASISKTTNPKAFNLCAINDNYYINVIPVLNASSVHKWVTNMIFNSNDIETTIKQKEEKEKYNTKEKIKKEDKTLKEKKNKKQLNKYKLMDQLLEANINYDTDLITLPYLVGERYPVADTNIRGCYYGLNPNTSLVDLVISALEGVAYSLKQGIEDLNITPKTISLIGGGALTKVWNQIFANIFETPVTVYSDSEYLPSISLTSAVLINENKVNTYHQFIEELLTTKEKQTYYPTQNKQRKDNYKIKFTNFKKLYPALKDLNN